MTIRPNIASKIDSSASGISDSVHDLMREAKPMMSQAAERAQQFVHESMEAASALRSDVEHSASEMTSHARHMIRHEPFKAMLIAAGIGAAITALVGLLARPHSNQRDH
jgi:ElaB/YqjD/DUF883 family membrane-anchored ribosome-binding protein